MKAKNQVNLKDRMVKFAKKNDLEYSQTFNQKDETWTIRVHGEEYVMDVVIFERELYSTPLCCLVKKTEDNPLGSCSDSQVRKWTGEICKTYNQMFKRFVRFEYNLHI